MSEAQQSAIDPAPNQAAAEIGLRLTVEADLDFVLAAEQAPENSQFVPGWSREQHLYESEGFVTEGILRECLKTDHGRESMVIMSMPKDEYLEEDAALSD